jgi:hypothetical protein
VSCGIGVWFGSSTFLDIEAPVEFDVTLAGPPAGLWTSKERGDEADGAPGEGATGDDTEENESSDNFAILGGGGRTMPSRYSPEKIISVSR